MKQETPILVILGNPPYNGFAGMSRWTRNGNSSEAYRSDETRVRCPRAEGLNDLYVRFFRMAERRIAEKTKCGVVCFISNYSWLDGSVVHRDAGALSRGVRRGPHRLPERRQVQDRQGRALTVRRIRASSRPRATRSASKSAPPSRPWCARRITGHCRRDRLPAPLGTGQAHGAIGDGGSRTGSPLWWASSLSCHSVFPSCVVTTLTRIRWLVRRGRFGWRPMG